tara:strand:- start:1299 stop:2246 length:948 start_codon:yes stop_codon:yes gene_type:complete
MNNNFEQQLIELSKIVGKNKTAFCIGTFDGVHKGHMSLFKNLISISKERKLKSLSLVFNKRPREVINKNYFRPYLSTLSHRINKIKNIGLDFVVSLEFNQELKKLSGRKFLEKLLKFGNIKTMVVSIDTKIGCDQISGYKLELLCASLGIEVNFIDMENIKEKIISSSKISNLLQKGKIINANNYLGENYILSGKVEKGDQIGRTIGFPTANIKLDEKIQLPSNGIYACYVILRNRKLRGALSLGNRPTIKNDSSYKIEVFIINFKENIYEEIIDILIVDKIRDQVDFDSLSELKNQMKKDIIKINKILNKKNES